MRIRAWTAFASNNSGSYVIVGTFETADVASAVATELAAVVARHHLWKNSDDPPPSPLARHARKHDVAFDDEPSDAWPQYTGETPPAVWAVGRQLFLHTPYTVSMPRELGALLYAHGGRVSLEIDHAHHPLIATFHIHIPWKVRDQMDVPARIQSLVDALHAGPLAAHAEGLAPAWRGILPGATHAFGEPDLTLAASFRDLPAAFTAIAALCPDLYLTIQLSEAPAHGDPLAHLRPCLPEASPSASS